MSAIYAPQAIEHDHGRVLVFDSATRVEGYVAEHVFVQPLHVTISDLALVPSS